MYAYIGLLSSNLNASHSVRIVFETALNVEASFCAHVMVPKKKQIKAYMLNLTVKQYIYSIVKCANWWVSENLPAWTLCLADMESLIVRGVSCVLCVCDRANNNGWEDSVFNFTCPTFRSLYFVFIYRDIEL